MTALGLTSPWALYAISNLRQDAYNYEVPKSSSDNVQIALEVFIDKKSAESGDSFVKPLRLWGIDKQDGKYRSVQLDHPIKKEEIPSMALAIQQYLAPDSNDKVPKASSNGEVNGDKLVVRVAETEYKPSTIASIVPKEWKGKSEHV